MASLRAYLRWLLVCMVMTHSSVIAAVVDVSADVTALSPSVELCEDPRNQFTSVAQALEKCEFKAANAGAIAKGFSASTWWLRTRLVNPGTVALDRWISVGHPKMSLVYLYYRSPGSDQWIEKQSGIMIAAAQRAVVATTPVLPVRLEAGQEIEVLVSANSQSAVDLTMYAWESHRYMSTYQQMQLAHAIALGGLLLTGLFALAIYFQFKDRAFLYYGLAMWCEIGVELVNSGVWAQYLWPRDYPFPLELLPTFVAGAVIGFGLFLHSFLGDLKRFPITLRLFHTSMAVLLAALFWAVAIQYRQGGLVWSLSVVFMLFFSLALITQAAWQGSRQARMLMVTTSAIALLELLRLGVTLGLDSISITMIASAPWAFVLTAPAVLVGISRHSREMHEKYVLEKQTAAVRSQLLARVGHDLRAPLSTILGFSRMLESESLRTSPREAGMAIGRSGQLLLRQIDDLLDLARHDVGQLKLILKPLHLQSWLNGIRINAELMSLHAGNQFELVAHDLPQAIVVDADRLNQVLTNLLTNANRATTNGRITLTCLATGKGDNRVNLIFAVADTGHGISAKDQVRIFEPFEKAGGIYNSASVGMGLGLAISRNLVEMMGGKIGLTSEPGKGSRFEFSISCEVTSKLADSVSSARPAAEPDKPAQLARSRKSILLADDNEADRLFIRDMLSDAGYQVVMVEGAKSAMAQATQPWHAVVTDQYMIDGDGWQVLEHFKGVNSELPVILISQVQPRPPIGWSRLQFDATLIKPVSPTALLKALDKAFARAPLVRPSEGKLVELRKLIQAGEVTLIEQWAVQLIADEARFQTFAEQIRQALFKLDFDRLRALSLPHTD